jgi:hypothetical protein
MENSLPESIDYEISAHFLKNAKDNLATKVLDLVASKYISGYDRHSLGIVIGNDKDLDNLYCFPEYPGANIIQQPVPIYEADRNLVSRIRTQEGISIVDKAGYIMKNGVKLPEADCEFLKGYYQVEDIGQVCQKLGINSAVGGKTLALIDLSINYPQLAIARLDGENYLLKAGKRYPLLR